MKPEVKKAIDSCLTRWRKYTKVQNLDHVKLGTDNCALCSLFYSYENPKIRSKDDCRDCPINKVTGRRYCVGTSYEAAVSADRADDVSDFNSAAYGMVAVLELCKLHD